MEAIQVELINLVILVLTTLVGYATKQVSSYLKKRGALAELENNKVLVDIAVNAVEQMFKEADGITKFETAKAELVKMLNDKKIKVSEEQLNLMIEQAVKAMKENTVK